MADYALVFKEPPPPQRTVGAPRKMSRPPALELVKETPPERYVAPVSHRAHGTYAKYVIERCKCEPCRQANRDYERARQHAISRPDETWVPYVPAGPARRHCRALMANGVGLKQIARTSGVPHGSLSKLIYGDPKRGMGPSKRIRPQTSAKILAVRPDQLADGARVPAAASWRLIDELVAAGYWKAWIAHQLGQKGQGLQLSRHEVTAGNARAIAVLHARHINQPPPRRPSRWDNR